MLALAQPCSIIGEHMIGAFHHPKYESIWSFRPEKNGGGGTTKTVLRFTGYPGSTHESVVFATNAHIWGGVATTV
jgi:hypothetical protein